MRALPGLPWPTLEAGLTLFSSEIDDAVRLQTVALDRVRLVNQDGVTRTRGVEALARWRKPPYVVTASYLYLDAREPAESGSGHRTVPLTPGHSAGLVAMWEQHDRGRIVAVARQLMELCPGFGVPDAHGSIAP